jgi:predicted Fe-Mo cluster-binding NifX family protein
MIRAIATDDKLTVSKVFGRARYFAIFNGSDAEPLFLEGTFATEHGAGTGAASLLAEHGVQEAIGSEFGPKAQGALIDAGIALTIAKAGTAFAELLNR